jgi:hypothetical protein
MLADICLTAGYCPAPAGNIDTADRRDRAAFSSDIYKD